MELDSVSRPTFASRIPSNFKGKIAATSYRAESIAEPIFEPVKPLLQPAW